MIENNFNKKCSFCNSQTKLIKGVDISTKMPIKIFKCSNKKCEHTEIVKLS